MTLLSGVAYIMPNVGPKFEHKVPVNGIILVQDAIRIAERDISSMYAAV